MQYMKVLWKHTHPDAPVLLYSELDDARWEVRKVEVFREGQVGYASRLGAEGSTILGLIPIPPLSEIAADPAFEPIEITKDEFEDIWKRATTGGAKQT